LTTTLLLFYYWGDIAFNNTVHTTLGILMVILVAGLFLGLQFFFNFSRASSKAAADKSTENP